jgi:hypothetical protein
MAFRPDGTRYLLPPIATFPDDVIGSEMPFEGNVTQGIEAPLASYPPANSYSGLPRAEQDYGTHSHTYDVSPATTPLKGLDLSSSEPQFFHTLVLDPKAGHFVPAPEMEGGSIAKPPKVHVRGAGHDDESKGGSGSADGHEHGQDGSVKPVEGDGSLPGVSDDPLAESDGIDSITVNQIAIADQDASILVSGYLGQVVARVQIDQDLLMDQDVQIDFSIDGDGHLYLYLDQDMRIDQNVQIDIKIYDVDGVLYIDLYLYDRVEIEQDTTIDMEVGDGDPGATVLLDQEIQISQDVDVDIDIEDDLEERYTVTVKVDTIQKADVDQDAFVDVKNVNGDLETDVTAIQTANVEQQTIVYADFVMV